MKKALSVILSVILILSVLPLASYAVTYYSVYVGGTEITDENCSDVFGDGSVIFDADERKLTLTDYSYEGIGTKINDMNGSTGRAAIYALGDLTIELVGENSVTMTSYGAVKGVGVAVGKGNLTICGEGTLNANGIDAIRDDKHSYGILVFSVYDSGVGDYVGGELTVENATVNAKGGELSIPSFDTDYNNLRVEEGNGKYTNSYGIYTSKGMTFNNADVTASSGKAYYYSVAVYSNDDNIKIIGSTFNAAADWVYYDGTYGIYAYEELEIKDSTVTAKCFDSNADDYYSIGIVSDKCTVENSTVNIEVGECFEEGAYGLKTSDLSVKDSTVNVAQDIAYYDSYGIYVGDDGAVIDNSKINIYPKNDGKYYDCGIYASCSTGDPALKVINGSTVNIVSFGSRGITIRRGNLEIAGSTVSAVAPKNVVLEACGSCGVYINSPNYYNSSDGGNIVITDNGSLTAVAADIQTDLNVSKDQNSYGIYAGSNKIYVTDGTLNVKAGNVTGDYEYADSLGISTSELIATGSKVTVISGNAPDYSRGIYASQNSGYYMNFINSNVTILTGNANEVYGIYMSVTGSPLVLDEGTSLTIHTGNAEYRNCGIDSYAGLTVDGGSTVFVTTGSAGESENYGIYAPSDYRGNFALTDGTITVYAGKGGTKQYGRSYGIYTGNDFIVGEKGVINVITAGGASGTNIAIALGYPSPVEINGVVHAQAGPVGELDEGETPYEYNPAVSVGVLDLYPDAHRPLVIEGFLETCGYDNAIAAGNKANTSQTVKAPVISVSENYDGSGAQNIAGDGDFAYYYTSDNMRYFVTEATPCKVSFNANGGTGEMADVEFDGVTEYELPDCSFTAPDGLEFDRWDLGEVGDTITVSGDTTLTAQWWKGFPDVHRGDWFYNYVKICAKAGIVKGYTNGNFGPNDSLQRQDFVLILARLYGANLDGFKDAQCTLSDVPEGQYYTEAIKWAVYTGIITGYNNGKFGVGDKITREQIATIIYRLALMEGFDEDISEYYEELDGYVDAGKVSAFAKDGMAFCVHNKIITGKKDIYLAPTDNASRAEITAIIVRAFG